MGLYEGDNKEKKLAHTESHEGLSDLLQRSPFAASARACTASHEGLLDLMQRSPFAASADDSHGVTPALDFA